ncbi:PREDICTED: collagen alpha-1(X) chain-like [Nipponia nippon]|uniref:collagen alpha-1(X) chain-like n=1 Tax=Nipponia nippon TaxID=128390 RepID=UPI000511A3DB|nr:PREDICTED: collagen alpha-1(X) chain-like [Nipponia nippon]
MWQLLAWGSPAHTWGDEAQFGTELDPITRLASGSGLLSPGAARGQATPAHWDRRQINPKPPGKLAAAVGRPCEASALWPPRNRSSTVPPKPSAALTGPPKAVGCRGAPRGTGSPRREGAGFPGARGAPGWGPSGLGNKEELKSGQGGCGRDRLAIVFKGHQGFGGDRGCSGKGIWGLW